LDKFLIDWVFSKIFSIKSIFYKFLHIYYVSELYSLYYFFNNKLK
jgi:hypothetical protein